MIPVQPVEEPDSFNEKVRIPGNRSISEKVGKIPNQPRKKGRRHKKIADNESEIPSKKFQPFWREVIGELRKAYNYVCAYSCFRIHEVTGAASVDHMVPVSKDWKLVYEWKNYRLACALVNSAKRDYEDVLDPFEIEDDWFELELVGFQVKPGKKLSGELELRIQQTIERLKLNGNVFRNRREHDAEDFWDGKIIFAVLERESPFVARELKRQNRATTRTVRMRSEQELE